MKPQNENSPKGKCLESFCKKYLIYLERITKLWKHGSSGLSNGVKNNSNAFFCYTMYNKVGGLFLFLA